MTWVRAKVSTFYRTTRVTPGMRLDVPDDVARRWARLGLADLDQPEVPATPPVEQTTTTVATATISTLDEAAEALATTEAVETTDAPATAAAPDPELEPAGNPLAEMITAVASATPTATDESTFFVPADTEAIKVPTPRKRRGKAGADSELLRPE